jgi:hypothetical protein
MRVVHDSLYIGLDNAVCNRNGLMRVVYAISMIFSLRK